MKKAIIIVVSIIFVQILYANGIKENQAKILFNQLVEEERYYHEEYHSPAARKLVRLGIDVVPIAAEGMKSDDDYVAHWSRIILTDIGKPSVPFLIELTKTKKLKVREEALFSLAIILEHSGIYKMTENEKEKEIKPILLELLHNETPTIRKWSLYALKYFQDEETTKIIISSLKDSSAIVREQAAFSLRDKKSDLVGQHLINTLKDTDEKVRAAVASSLGSRKDKGLIKVLAKLRKDPSPYVRYRAVQSLSSLCDLRSIRVLVNFLDDNENCGMGSSGHEAACAIETIIGRKDRLYQEEARKWWESIGKKKYGNLVIPEKPAKYIFPNYVNSAALTQKVNKYLKLIANNLPNGWEILWIDECDTPDSWERLNESDKGIRIHIWQPLVTVKTISGDVNPNIDIFIMYSDWEGINKIKNQKIIKKNIIRGFIEGYTGKHRGYPYFLGSNNEILLFLLCSELSNWKNAQNDIAKVIGINRINTNENYKIIKWIDKKNNEILFTSDDIIRFDWKKQIFELKRKTALELEEKRKKIGSFVVKVNGTLIYEGCFISSFSSISYMEPCIIDRFNDEVLPPMYKISAGYPVDFKNASEKRFNPLMYEILKQQGKIVDIKETDDVLPIGSVWYKLIGIETEVFPEAFKKERELIISLMINKEKDLKLMTDRLEVNVTVQEAKSNRTILNCTENIPLKFLNNKEKYIFRKRLKNINITSELYIISKIIFYKSNKPVFVFEPLSSFLKVKDKDIIYYMKQAIIEIGTEIFSENFNNNQETISNITINKYYTGATNIDKLFYQISLIHNGITISSYITEIPLEFLDNGKTFTFQRKLNNVKIHDGSYKLKEKIVAYKFNNNRLEPIFIWGRPAKKVE